MEAKEDGFLLKGEYHEAWRFYYNPVHSVNPNGLAPPPFQTGNSDVRSNKGKWIPMRNNGSFVIVSENDLNNVICTKSCAGYPMGEAYANSIILSLAPQMLEACEMMYNKYAQSNETHDDETQEIGFKLEEIINTIDKAKGEA